MTPKKWKMIKKMEDDQKKGENENNDLKKNKMEEDLKEINRKWKTT